MGCIDEALMRDMLDVACVCGCEISQTRLIQESPLFPSRKKQRMSIQGGKYGWMVVIPQHKNQHESRTRHLECILNLRVRSDTISRRIARVLFASPVGETWYTGMIPPVRIGL